MNKHPIVTDKSRQRADEFDLDIRVFDEWMTRQLNLLVGRNLKYATSQQMKSLDRNNKKSFNRG